MAAAIKKNHSRRRLAALTFLSNISLDGSHRDTKSPPNDNTTFNFDSTAFQIDIDASMDEILESAQDKSQVHTSFSSDSEGMPTPAKTTLVAILDQNNHYPTLAGNIYHPFRERAGTTGSEYSLPERRIIDSLQYNKRIANQASALNEDNIKHACHSSTESIGSLRLKLHLKNKALNNSHSGCTNDDTLPEVTQQLCLMQKPLNGNKYEDDKLVLVSNKAPFIVFSAMPYNKGQRSSCSDVRKDYSRKKPPVQRPLSSINDSIDAFGLLGIERGNDGQEISYGRLLEPSGHFTRDKKLRTNDKEALGFMHFVPNKHQLVSRTIEWNLDNSKWCLSYDTATNRSPQHSTCESPPMSFSADSKVYDCDNESVPYNPHLLDDPDLIAGKNRITFTSYMASVMEYVRPSDLKKEMNDKFREKFPHIQLTLSKLRSLKREMKKIAKSDGIDLLTVAMAYVYFEKLILRNVVTKQTRKLCAGASLLLAAKLNDVKGDDLKSLMERIENVFRLNHKDLITSEFAVLVTLEFGLHLPTWEIFPHYQRLLYES